MTRRHPSSHSRSLLAHSRLEVTIDDLMASHELRHRFRNEGTGPVEIVYTFPVPLDAAFLGMEATIAGETRVARVQPRRSAREAFDDAIADVRPRERNVSTPSTSLTSSRCACTSGSSSARAEPILAAT